jgi:S1-C subfamily serine protease
MNPKAVYDAVKKATVAIVLEHPERVPAKPFTIVGSGFCIDPRGIVVTCEHVFRPFVDPDAYKKLMEAVSDGRPAASFEAQAFRPTAVFHSHVEGTRVYMPLVAVDNVVTKTNFDLAALKLHSHAAFKTGFPSLPIAPYEDIHEMMEVGTCGFPLGNVLQEQLGTVTSSFTKGIISSIIPAPGARCEDVKGFQLDLTATNGNSGGPVFSLQTGEILGVLQGGAMHPHGYAVQGITKAEPIYPLLQNDLIERLAASKGIDEFKSAATRDP